MSGGVNEAAAPIDHVNFRVCLKRFQDALYDGRSCEVIIGVQPADDVPGTFRKSHIDCMSLAAVAAYMERSVGVVLLVRAEHFQGPIGRPSIENDVLRWRNALRLDAFQRLRQKLRLIQAWCDKR